MSPLTESGPVTREIVEDSRTMLAGMTVSRWLVATRIHSPVTMHAESTEVRSNLGAM